jgi:NAD(P)H-nitrite reductase large subunit
VLGDQMILGAVVMGDQKIARPLREMIHNQVDITPIREQLLQSSAQSGQVLIDHWVKSSN